MLQIPTQKNLQVKEVNLFHNLGEIFIRSFYSIGFCIWLNLLMDVLGCDKHLNFQEDRCPKAVILKTY